MGRRIRTRSGWDLLSAASTRAGATAMSSRLPAHAGSKPRAEGNRDGAGNGGRELQVAPDGWAGAGDGGDGGGRGAWVSPAAGERRIQQGTKGKEKVGPAEWSETNLYILILLPKAG